MVSVPDHAPLPPAPESLPRLPARADGLWWWLPAWILVGALYAFSLLAILSIGVLMLPIAIVSTVVLARSEGRRLWASGLLAGIGVPCLWIAFMNRNGPGNVCTRSAGGQSCVHEWNPWVWLAIGLAFVLSGIAVGVMMHLGSKTRRAGRT